MINKILSKKFLNKYFLNNWSLIQFNFMFIIFNILNLIFDKKNSIILSAIIICCKIFWNDNYSKYNFYNSIFVKILGTLIAYKISFKQTNEKIKYILSIFVILEITSIYFYKISLLTYIIDFFNKKEKFENDRLNFYLGKNLIKHKHVNINEFENFKIIDDLTLNKNTHDEVYDEPLKKLLIKTNNTDKKFVFTRGDAINKDQQNMITLSKNRTEFNNDSVLLRSFNFDRHWYYYYNKPNDIPFKYKKNKIFWRGVTTGCSDNFEAHRWNPRKVNRFNLVTKWFDKNENIDIGFSNVHRNWLKKDYQKYVKGKCKPEDFLKCKYILSIEGNDKDSGLNWKLNSNSLVLMPKPRVTSWLMETTLIPNYHYLLIKDDFSDLEEILFWCNNNQNKCKKIIKNANKFMKQFSDNNYESKLEERVINKYFEIVN